MKVYVYGTLKRGHHNHTFLKGSKFLGEANTGPGYKLVIRGLPFLLEDTDGEGCTGELYEVTNLTLKRLDALEGSPDWYVRKLISVFCNGEEHKAYCYIMPQERMGR
jgi:gamma-glutamylaminecyclotransferase